MGNGIAQVAATSGFNVTMMDVVSEQLENAQATIAKSVGKLFEKDKIKAGRKEAAQNGRCQPFRTQNRQRVL